MRPEQGTLISRAQAMAALLELITDQPLIVCNGFPSREVQKLADRPQNFYMIGSMGNAPAIALGVALAKPSKQVITFDGDGNVLMGVVPLEKVAKAAGYVNVERVLEREDLVYEFKDMLKKDGPSMLLIKVNEFQEDAERIRLDPHELTKRFMEAIK
jgi:thiamine pyrophosphate-dependent acetolactate synthase large subunit-like protein